MARPVDPAGAAPSPAATGIPSTAATKDATVEVVYALSTSQAIVRIVLPATGLTALQAFELSGLSDRYPQIRQQPVVLGIYGEVCRPDRALSPGDRVEIYRPLRQDPRVMRRERVASQARPKRGKR